MSLASWQLPHMDRAMSAMALDRLKPLNVPAGLMDDPLYGSAEQLELYRQKRHRYGDVVVSCGPECLSVRRSGDRFEVSYQYWCDGLVWGLVMDLPLSARRHPHRRGWLLEAPALVAVRLIEPRPQTSGGGQLQLTDPLEQAVAEVRQLGHRLGAAVRRDKLSGV
jgi:hypothetical protein